MPEHLDLVCHGTEEQGVIVRIVASGPLVFFLHWVQPLSITVPDIQRSWKTRRPYLSHAS